MKVIDLLKVIAPDSNHNVILESLSTFEKGSGGIWEGNADEFVFNYQRLGFYETIAESVVLSLDNEKHNDDYFLHIVYED